MQVEALKRNLKDHIYNLNSYGSQPGFERTWPMWISGGTTPSLPWTRPSTSWWPDADGQPPQRQHDQSSQRKRQGSRRSSLGRP
jgi:hypothetical protein